MNSRDAGQGRLIIPSDVDRDAYIRKCYDTGRAAIFTYGAGIIRNASICKHCIDDLIFPLTPQDYGSPVLYIKTPNREEYSIYGVFKETDEIFDITEYQFSIGKKSGDGVAVISGDADDGSIVITVNHNKKGGKLTIVVGNDKVPSILEFNVSGKINSDSNEYNISAYDKVSFTLPKGTSGGVTTMEYVKGKGFNYLDEFGNIQKIDSNSHVINHKKAVTFGTGTDPAILGNAMSTLMTQFITKVSAATVMVNGVPTPLINAADIGTLLADVTKITSKYVKIQ